MDSDRNDNWVSVSALFTTWVLSIFIPLLNHNQGKYFTILSNETSSAKYFPFSTGSLSSVRRLVQPEPTNSNVHFDSLVDEHVLATRDMCVVRDDYVIQFKVSGGVLQAVI